MADDESFEELMNQGSLGSPGARRLRERTSVEKARLVLRVVELRQALDSASPETSRLALVRVNDELDGAMEELQKSREGTAAALPFVRTAHSLARRHGNLDAALELLGEARKIFDDAGDWEGSAQVLTAVCALSIREGRPSRALQALHEVSELLASHTESGARIGTLAHHLKRVTRRTPRRTNSAPQEADSESPS